VYDFDLDAALANLVSDESPTLLAMVLEMPDLWRAGLIIDTVRPN
jgi:hypothetical protein